jgi:tetratricopeptide (TPR) repeat protein
LDSDQERSQRIINPTVKREHSTYILFGVLILLLGIAAWRTYSGDNVWSVSLAHNSPKLKSSDPGDSLLVLKLNKEAFGLRMSNPQQTSFLADSALEIAKRIGYLSGIAESHRLIGIGAYYQNDPDFAIWNYLEAFRYFKILNDQSNQAKVYNNIGNLYSDINDPAKSLFYFKKSLDISLLLNNQVLTAGLYFNIARAYEQQSRYSDALRYFDKAYEFFRKVNDEVYITLYFQNTGVVYFKQGSFEKAESLLTTAVSKARKLKLYKTICGCYLVLSRIYIQKGSYAQAEKILAEGIQYADLLDDKDVKHELLYKRYELSLVLKDYKGAVGILADLYKKDSLDLNNKLSQNVGITAQHYFQQQQLQDNQLVIAEQKYREAKFRWIIALSISLFLVCTLLVVIVHLVRQKRRKIKETAIQKDIISLEQKALQAMMNPHFLFNIMNSIRYLINWSDKETATQTLDEFSGLLRKHLEICMKPSVSVMKEMDYLKSYLALERVRLSGRMNYDIEVDPEIDTEEIYIPSMLIHPFVENAVWHGIAPKEEGGSINVSVALFDSSLHITIIDDGVGIGNSRGKPKIFHESHGMELIFERVNLLNKLNERPIVIEQAQTGDYGTKVLIIVPVILED